MKLSGSFKGLCLKLPTVINIPTTDKEQQKIKTTLIKYLVMKSFKNCTLLSFNINLISKQYQYTPQRCLKGSSSLLLCF